MHKLTPKRFDALIRSMRNRKVAVFGDLILDRYIFGQVTRISQEAPVPVVNVRQETGRLGGAANVARNLAVLGLKPVCVGLHGDDPGGKELRRLFKAARLNSRWLVSDPTRPTTEKTRVVAHGQQVVRIDNEVTAEISPSLEDRLLKKLESGLQGVSGVIISDYCKGAVTRRLIESVIRMARRRNLFVAVDPKESHFPAYTGASLITPNKKEAEEGSGIRITDDKSLQEAGWALKERLGLKACLITLGEGGMALFEAERRFTHIPTLASEVFDVTGAGDTVISAFTAAVAGGATLEEAARFSNAAAGIVVREIGTAAARVADIRATLFGK